MKVLSLIVVLAIATSALAQYNPLPVVPDVDLNLYAGNWYEIATLPSFFEKNCYCSTSNYTVNVDKTVSIKNVCNYGSSSGYLVVDKATAYPNDPINGTVTSGNWSIEYFGFLKEPYDVLALDSNYTYALVGSPKRTFLWILSRQPTLDDDTYNQLLTLATSEQFNAAAVVKTYQGSDCNYAYNLEEALTV